MPDLRADAQPSDKTGEKRNQLITRIRAWRAYQKGASLMSRKSRPEMVDSNHRRARRRALLIGRYLADDEFTRALLASAKAEVETDWEAFCEHWGLTFEDGNVEDDIEMWCERHRSSGDTSPFELVDVCSSASFVPNDWPSVSTKIVWRPTEESRSDAAVRLRNALDKQVQAALDNISDAYERCCGKNPRQQRSPQLATHMNWLFERQRHRRTYDEIAESNPTGDSDTVRKACGRLAENIGLKLRCG